MFMRYHIIFFLLIQILISGCENYGHRNDTANSDSLMSQKYCGSCHVSVSPSMLDSTTWIDHVLPAMGKKLGIGVWHRNQYYSIKKNDSGDYISMAEWDKIVEYYGTQSPKNFQHRKRDQLQQGWSVFSLERPPGKFVGESTTTLVAIDSSSHTLYTSDGSGGLNKWNSSLKKIQSSMLPSQAVDMKFFDTPNRSSAIITCIGNIEATDSELGKLVMVNTQKIDSLEVMAERLRRPVNSISYDYDRDGNLETVIAGFGYNLGSLSIVRKNKKGIYINTAVWSVTGALQMESTDFNNDGWMDFLVLFAQGDEGIWLFENNRNGTFNKKRLLQFSPLNGSSSFQLVDFNNDGKQDILYTCGDNSDYSKVLKPFHGLYIYLQTDSGSFKQAYFYPIDGCTKAIAKDFDKDGKLEIATIAFFADLVDFPQGKFLFFKETSPLQFKPIEIPVKNEGRWMCMDAKDIDGDDDIDIVLGNYSRGFINQDSVKHNWNTTTPFIILKNNSSANSRP